ncbi:MAG: MFS transporter [Planctomycetaceae bacterium]
MNRYLPLICLALIHTVVDTSALLVSPIWNEITVECRLAGGSLIVVMLSQAMPTSLAQGVFGYLRDRRRMGVLLIGAPLLAVVCLTAIGPAVDPNRVPLLCGLFIVGGVAVGAFHPEAAVTVGSLLPENRTRALSIFMLGGSLGLAIGPTLSGLVVNAWGLGGLMRLMPVLVCLVPLLYWGVRSNRKGGASALTTRESLSVKQMFDGRLGLAMFLLLVCSFRLVPNMGMAKIVAFTLADRDFAPLEIGYVQSTFLVSGSVGMLLMAMLFRQGWERRFLIACPLIGLPFLGVLGWQGCPTWLFLAMLFPTGLVLWGTTPTMVSYAQQMFPRGAGLASAMTMGLAWGGGGLIEVGFTAHFRDINAPQFAVWAFIPFVAVSALGAWFLPDPGTDSIALPLPKQSPTEEEVGFDGSATSENEDEKK